MALSFAGNGHGVMEQGQLTIAERIDRIVVTFKAARTVAERVGYCPELIAYLESTDLYYRSVAYEGAAMALAFHEFNTGDGSHTGYNALALNEGVAYVTNIHIGYGWASAEANISLVPLDVRYPHDLLTLDGIGYWYGLFRRRLTVGSQGFPDNISDRGLPGFDRGVGRSMWYISKGDLNVLLNMARAFPAERQANLWRGIGIAASFVGGCTDSQLMALWTAAGPFQRELSDGARRVVISRKKAGTPLHDVKRARAIWKMETQSAG